MIEVIDLIPSIISGIITSIIIGMTYLIWNTLCKPFIQKKTVNFNSKEKTMLGIHLGALTLGIMMIVIGIIMIYHPIHGYINIEIPDGGEEAKKVYEYIVVSTSIGLVLLSVGSIGFTLSLMKLWRLFSSVQIS